MKWKQDLTYLQAFTRAKDLWMSGKMLYKLTCVLLNTVKNLQTSCIMTSCDFSWKMMNLCLKPSMPVVLILTSFQQALQAACKEDGGIKSKSLSHQASCKWPPCGPNQSDKTSVDRPPIRKKQNFKSRPPSHKQYTSEQQQVSPYKRKFDHKQAHTSKERCSKCDDSRYVEGFKCPVKKYQCKSCHKYEHHTSLCLKKQVPFPVKSPKAHPLQA